MSQKKESISKDKRKRAGDIFTLQTEAKMILTEINTLSDDEAEILAEMYRDYANPIQSIGKKALKEAF